MGIRGDRAGRVLPPRLAGWSWHALSWEDVARVVDTDPEKGLTERQAHSRPAAARLEEVPAWRLGAALFVRQWKGGVIVILCAAALAFWLLGHRNDSLGIAFSVLFAVTLGFVTDFRSQRALAALKTLNAPAACVIRDGILIEIPAGRVVLGDVVVLRGGGVVPADGRLIQASELRIDESALTGESASAAKTPEPVAAAVPLAERSNMAYAGTTTVTGTGRMIVTETGLDAELGRIGKLVREYRKEETPLERQVESLGRRLGLLVIGLCSAATALGLLLGQPVWEMLETGFMLAIAAIPEGLPAVTTAALAGGVRRMVRARAIVRRLAAVEVLGAVDVICTDKTGTLTENVMRAAVVCLPGRRLDVSGSGYAPEGRFSNGTTEVDPREDEDLQRLLWIAALCNNAALESHGGWHIHGSPTEGALLTLALQGGLDQEGVRLRHPRVYEAAFTSARKLMSVVVADASGARWGLAKGAVGALLPLCDFVQAAPGGRPLSDAARDEIRLEAQRLGVQGLRVLGLAYRRVDAAELGDPERRLVWAGMVGLLDPPRRNAAQAVRSLAAAGIRTIMVTGDQKNTAAAVAARLGLSPNENGARDARELADILRRSAWDELDRIAVFARVAPEDKLRLVEALKGRGHIVAMTGDGINDAPALKAADIGVAMGSGAADVAKEAADLVITDAEYATLTAAVEEGRRIYANLQRAAGYLLLCSLSSIGLVMGGIALGLPLAMTALQVLWLNLVVHVFPGVALAVAPNPRRFMREPPRSREATLLGWREIGAIARRSLVISAAALAVFAINSGGDLKPARTMAIATLGLSLLLETFSAGRIMWPAIAASLSILAAMLYVPALRELLATVPLTPGQWTEPVAASLVCLAARDLWERLTRN